MCYGNINFLHCSQGRKFDRFFLFSRVWFTYIILVNVDKLWSSNRWAINLFTQVSVFFPILLLCSWNMTFVQSQTLKWKCFKVYRSQTTENNLPICVQNDVKMRHNVSRNWKCKKSFSNLKSWEHNWSSTYLCDRLTVWPSRTLYISLVDAFGSP